MIVSPPCYKTAWLALEPKLWWEHRVLVQVYRAWQLWQSGFGQIFPTGNWWWWEWWFTSAIYHSISEKISIPFTCSRVTTGKVKGDASHLTYIVLLKALHSDIGASCQRLVIPNSEIRIPAKHQEHGKMGINEHGVKHQVDSLQTGDIIICCILLQESWS